MSRNRHSYSSKTLHTTRPLVEINRSNKNTVPLRKNSPINPNINEAFIDLDKSILLQIFNEFKSIYKKTDSDILKSNVSNDILENLFNSDGFNFTIFTNLIVNIKKNKRVDNMYVIKFKFRVKSGDKYINIYPEYAITLPSRVRYRSKSRSRSIEEPPSFGGKTRRKRGNHHKKNSKTTRSK